ncbi:MAG TPA: 1-(5-phosphoribosyl)-5-[(5-phosphoribosylamino)methylideneamino] imidazole-4-carboxamide isomerase [Sphingomicrobium sp.]|nr:1-(5-phosphoribosyl)-5-[(5-phosphoribosylamino)methylideneamino] imidazole-4-carboxamide isomerase [Sphingomicrobium sp.]
MIVYPAMDLMGGAVVRLKQGRFEDHTNYTALPADALASFAEAGAEWAHIVDLDGARAKAPVQHDLIAHLARENVLKLQVGGGFRTREQVARMLEAGAARVVIGSLAVKEPELIARWLDEFGNERVTLSLDVRMSNGQPMVAMSGWTEASGATLWDIAAYYPGAKHLLLTDIGRDGMLAGPNFDLLDEAVERLPHLRIQASGGVSSIADLERLRTDGAIIGKAMWEGLITLEEALARARA